jgi:hypothetical protein
MVLLHALLTIHPNRQRSIRRIFPRFEEPEVRVDLVRLVLYTKIGECFGRKMDIAREATDAFCSLAEIGPM